MPHQLHIIYESHTGNTRRMAQAVAEGAREVEGVEVILKRVSEANVDDLTDAEAIILGAPTRNTKVPAAMSQFLKRMEKVPLRGKLGAAFGSYGWSGEAVASSDPLSLARDSGCLAREFEPSQRLTKVPWRSAGRWGQGLPAGSTKIQRNSSKRPAGPHIIPSGRGLQSQNTDLHSAGGHGRKPLLGSAARGLAGRAAAKTVTDVRC